MNAMAYPQPYHPGQGSTFNQIVKRPLTDAEMHLPAGVYKNFQRGLRGISVLCLILFVVNVYMLSALVSDPITYDSLSMMLTVFMLVMGMAAMGMSVNSFVVRKKIEQVMREGTAIEVFGPAYRNSAMGKVQSWTVGPISMLPTRSLEGLLQEGAPTSVLCLPRLKAAIAVNNYGLKQGARIMFPPNLEAMAVPMGPVGMPAGGQMSSAEYPAYGPPIPQVQPPQTDFSEEIPPPPPD